jgi:HD superfamily phosphohydrolase
MESSSLGGIYTLSQSITFTNYIFDNVHGYIGLTFIEDQIERLEIFQRLRRIKQLGLVNWVFPGAEHTRYSHSLGVMHIIDQMAIRLDFNDDDRQILRLAGMLHDIGHYPLSHIGEYAYKQVPADIDFFLDNAQKVKDSIERLKEFRALDSV